MTERGKGIALAVSVTLNVVLVAAVVAGLWMAREAWRDRMEHRGPPLFEAARTLPRADQDRLRGDMRAAAGEARADFREARELRRKAAELAAAPNYDRDAVLQALRAANAAEMRGRGKLDDRLTTVFEGLSPQARKVLAPGFEHRSRGLRDGGRGHGRHDHGEGPPAAASPDAAPAAPPAAATPAAR
jgi:uncharacterized membrane protein